MPEHDWDDDDRIAVVGMACRVPGAGDVDTFWANLVRGADAIERRPAGPADPPGYVAAFGRIEGVEDFDAEFFAMTHREAAYLDPQQRLFLEQSWIALEHAGIDPDRFAGRIGVWGGCGFNGYLPLHLLPGLSGADALREYPAELLHGNDKDYLTSRVAYRLGLNGPAVTVQTACSTSLVAVAQAAQSLLDYQCDAALAGGSSVCLPQDWGYVYETGGIQSPDGVCRPFDADAAGTVFTSGVGVVVLKRLADALADGDRIHAVLLASAVNNDGAGKVGFAAPSADGQRAVLAEAYRTAGISPATIGYVEAHGTGTAVGDPIELSALDRVFTGIAPGSIPIGSVKSNLGHLNAASGVVGLLKTILAVRENLIPASLHFRRRNPHTDPDSPFSVITEARPFTGDGPRRAGVSSFGVGGTNAHVIVEQPPPAGPAASSGRPVLLPVTARSPEALAAARAGLAARLDGAISLGDVAYTLRRRRRHFEHRSFVVAADCATAAAELARAGDTVTTGPAAVALLFPGQGTQYSGMAAGLYATCPVFAETLDECLKLLAPALGADLRDLLLGPSRDGADPLTRTDLAQPALFAVEYALARWWESVGIRPAAMLGHSVGEWVAACLAGVFDLPDALALVAARGRLMAQLPGGAMLAVEADEDTARALALRHGLSLAAVNAPGRCVLAGPTAAIEELAAETGGRRLVTSHAFHSALLDPMVEPFTALVAAVPRREPAIPFLSGLTGTWITPAEAVDPAYWARQARSAVRFADGVAALLTTGRPLLVESGPGHTLGRLARMSGTGVVTAASMPPAGDSTAADVALLRGAGTVWAAGAGLDWAALSPDTGRRVAANLPGYPFQRRRHWIEAPGTAYTGQQDPVPAPDATVPEPAAAGADDTLSRVLDLWRELLGDDTVAATDDLFELGGDSLLATRLVSRANRMFDVDLPLEDLLDDPTPARMAHLVTSAPALAPDRK
ncbi:beta-ketoacyl synthase N-terminal-like domain-containing protein [Dactylosporangium sp. NPDC000555]|uniref:type I polyketide synthase n=1 Tax=Dactylosporangium sp. NPDC000555 TaxID=3154260 RepID=UPI0033176AB6